MNGNDWMSEFAVTAMHPVPLWTAAALLILLLLISVIALRRSGSFGSIAFLFGMPALAIIAWSGWNFTDHAVRQQRAAEREALNVRLSQLNAAAVAPGSPLACLDAGAGDLVAAACEATIFARPETAAAATAYVEARLRLLADGADYSRRTKGSYDPALVQLRHGLEADRYGFVAHVLATRDGCTSDICDAFALFNDAEGVKANINARTFENNVTRYAAHWPEPKSPKVAENPPPEPPAAAGQTAVGGPSALTGFGRPIDFPSAASIPPVSIMTEAPAAPPPPADAAPARRPAAAPAAAARPR